MKRGWMCLGLLTAWLPVAAYSATGDPAEAARAIMAGQGATVVTLRLSTTVRLSAPDMGSTEMEFIIEATGYLLDKRGLIATSLYSTDPRRFYEEYAGEDADEYTIETEVRSIDVLFEDGSQLEAKAGLRDTDLDVAFFILEDPPGTLATARLAPAKTLQAFEPVVMLRRLGNVSSRATAGSLQRVQAVIDSPRRFYVIKDEITIGLGEPVYNLEGACVGLTALRTIKAAGSDTYFLYSGEDPNSAAIVLPIADVLDAASQHPGFEDLASGQ